MSLELGISFGLAGLTFIFAFMTTRIQVKEFRWFFLFLTFGVMTFSFNILQRFADLNGLTSISGILETFTVSLTVISSLILFLFFIYVIKVAIELYFPKKKKSFKDGVF